MKRFMAVYTGTPSAVEENGWNALSEDERRAREKAGVRAWHEWAESNRDRIADAGAPLGQTKRASSAGIAEAKNNLCAYVIIEAKTHEAAVKLFENHPHFTIFPGDAVEVMECLPPPAR